MTQTGKQHEVQIRRCAPVFYLKLLIEDVEDIPIAKQGLYCMGTRLYDHHSLADYRIDPEDKIELVLNMRGGNARSKLRH